ncbi:hypothetical protein [Nitrobacter sp. JJSN]|uniref:hypothetical protein n=1 Tax=Nitrobacter sp. JJSN TaxID=3453033 RepID=UPI003F7693BF
MAREQNTPFNGPNTDARDHHLQIVTSGLHRTAGPYTRRRGPPSQGWKTFLRNHADGIAAMDLFVVPTISFRLLL